MIILKSNDMHWLRNFNDDRKKDRLGGYSTVEAI